MSEEKIQVSELDQEIIECIKAGFEVNIRAGGEGVIATCFAMGAVRYSATATNRFTDIPQAVRTARAQLKRELGKR